MSNQHHIRITGRNRTKSLIGVPSSTENTIVFDLSAIPDQEWTTIFSFTWEQRLEFLPIDFANIQPRFEDDTLIVVTPSTLDMRLLERELQNIAEIANREHCPDDHTSQ